MLYRSARYVKKFGGRLNFAKAICPVVLLASEIYSLAFFNLKNQILPRFSLMLLGLYGRRGMHQDWVTFPFLTKKIFVDATERMQEFQAVQIDQPIKLISMEVFSCTKVHFRLTFNLVFLNLFWIFVLSNMLNHRYMTDVDSCSSILLNLGYHWFVVGMS